jgi:histidyl-tRNA synthetase
VEMLSAVSEVLQKLGFSDFTIQLNHRELLTALLNGAGIDTALHATALVAIDKLDKIGREGVRDDMTARGVARESAEKTLSAFEDLAAFEALVTREERGAAANQNIAEILRLADSTAARGHVKLTPRLARGLSYYTGAIMEVAVPDLAGSLGGGGRYDGLIGMFSSEQIPACGFSLGLERILVVMTERNMFPPNLASAAADVMVTLFEGEPVEEALKLAADLRSAGLRVDVYPEPDKLGKQFKYAASRGVKFVTIEGGDERARNEVTVKNMTTGDQQPVGRLAVADHLRTAIERFTNSEQRTANSEEQ